MAQHGDRGCFEVVHDRIALRAEPSVKANMVGSCKNGQILSGTVKDIKGIPWVKLDAASIEYYDMTKDVAWALIDGTSVGLGQLLKKTSKTLPEKEKPTNILKEAERWKVVFQDKVAVRQEPTTNGTVLGVRHPGDNIKVVAHKGDWVRLHSSEGFDPKAAWMLARKQGLGVLLELIGTAEEDEAKAAPSPAQKTKGAADYVQMRKEALSQEKKQNEKKAADKPDKSKAIEKSEDAESEATQARATASRAEFVVAHTKVIERSQPKITASVVKMRSQGVIVEGIPHDVNGEQWLKLETGWMLMDGEPVNLGILLMPTEDIAEDIVSWAEQHRSAPEGKAMVWTDETQGQLRALEEKARQQVVPLKPGLEILEVLQELERKDVLSAQDFSLGADGVEKLVLRFLLRARAGEVLFQEAGPKSSVWREDDFDALVKNVVHLMPFFCRELAPDCAAQRVLVLLHGGKVRGDDLLEDAKMMKISMPSTAIVLPEAPVVVDDDLELRSWWRIAEAIKDNEPKPDDLSPEELMAHVSQKMKAPQEAIARLVVTVKGAHKRFGDVPLIIGGFSMGSSLVAQSMEALQAADINPKGILILSGLFAPFKVGNAQCLAIHGYKDPVVPITLSQTVAKEMGSSVQLHVLSDLHHEVNDAVLERSIKFFDEVAPTNDALAGKVRDQEARDSEVRQAKLLRWVKNFANLAVMFDNDYFMSLIMDADMVRLPEYQTIGPVRYYLHDAGPSSRGLVILFHGKIGDLYKDTRELAEAYMKSLRLSVCVIDYRPKFSTFCVDAQVTLESIEQLSRSTSCPIIIHSIGIGSIMGMHCAMSCQALPTVVQQRFRLLVLDAPVANMKALPPIPTGCIAVDPIGNDNKLKYVGMPICLLSGDDRCTNPKSYPKHWAGMSGNFEVLSKEGKMRDSRLIDDKCLQVGAGGARLHSEFYQTCKEALERQQRETDKSTADLFLKEISSASAEEEALCNAFEGKESEVKSLMERVLKAASNKAIDNRLWEARQIGDITERSEAIQKLWLDVIGPILKGNDNFKEGAEGVKQLDTIATKFAEEDEGLKQVRDEVRDALDTRRLDRMCADLQRKYPGCPPVDELHRIMNSSLKFWTSEDCRADIKAKVHKIGPNQHGKFTKAMVVEAVSKLGSELNIKAARDAKIKGTDEEASKMLGDCFNAFNSLDPTLGAKGMKIQAACAGIINTVSDEMGAVSSNALTDKLPPLPLPPPEWSDGAELDIAVYIDRDCDLSIPIRAKRGCTIRDLKRLIAEAGDSGGIEESQVFLTFPMNAGGVSLHDETIVTERIRDLDLQEAEVLPRSQVQLSRQQMVSMLRDLSQGFSTVSFQRNLHDFKKKSKKDAEFGIARATLCAEVQKEVIAKYGWPSTRQGIMQMMEYMAVWNADPEQNTLNEHINKLIMMNE